MALKFFTGKPEAMPNRTTPDAPKVSAQEFMLGQLAERGTYTSLGMRPGADEFSDRQETGALIAHEAPDPVGGMMPAHTPEGEEPAAAMNRMRFLGQPNNEDQLAQTRVAMTTGFVADTVGPQASQAVKDATFSGNVGLPSVDYSGHGLNQSTPARDRAAAMLSEEIGAMIGRNPKDQAALMAIEKYL